MKRARRTRARIVGSAARPRLSVFRSNRGVYAQLIDDARGVTLAYASSREISAQEKGDGKGKSNVAGHVGTLIAQRAAKAGITKAVFDRGAYRYHGRVKAFAEGARKGGLRF